MIRHLTAYGCQLKREGANHSMWENPETEESQAVPRHNEIPDILVRSICKALGIPRPPG